MDVNFEDKQNNPEKPSLGGDDNADGVMDNFWTILLAAFLLGIIAGYYGNSYYFNDQSSEDSSVDSREMRQIEFSAAETGMGAGLRLEIPLSERFAVCTWKEWRGPNADQTHLNITRTDPDVGKSGHVRHFDYEPWRSYRVEAICHGSSGAGYKAGPVNLGDLSSENNFAE